MPPLRGCRGHFGNADRGLTPPAIACCRSAAMVRALVTISYFGRGLCSLCLSQLTQNNRKYLFQGIDCDSSKCVQVEYPGRRSRAGAGTEMFGNLVVSMLVRGCVGWAAWTCGPHPPARVNQLRGCLQVMCHRNVLESQELRALRQPTKRVCES